MTEQEPVAKEPDTFSSISDERQWGWGEENDVMFGFIESKGLGDELVTYTRKAADEERAEEQTEALGHWPLKDLVSIATGMPYLHSSKKDEVIAWLVKYQPDTVDRELS